jgi:peptide-methionine (S)-S-oxide reductase
MSDFEAAVAAIDAGDAGALRSLLDTHPELLHDRLENGRDDYFARPYLVWLVAGNPIRTGTLPANIVEITRLMLEAGAEGRDYALALVVSGQVPRECGVQLELIDVLVDAGADPNCLDAALAHRENAAAERLLERGARETLVASMCLARSYDLAASTPEERQVALAGAALHGRADAIRDLVAAGVDVNAFNPTGWHSHSTALHSAVDSGSVDAMQALVDAGADLTVKDTLFDGTPRDWANYLKRPNPFG